MNTIAKAPSDIRTVRRLLPLTGVWRWIFPLAAVALLLFLALYHLSGYPALWFDEGSYLHVPKNLVLHGVYADSSSDGYRFYGPTIAMGPTVLLPIALVFRLFGIGLLQARLVMALYLVAAVLAFHGLSVSMARISVPGKSAYVLAWIATALLVTSRGASILVYGRQVLGEVPGMFFLLVGLVIWFHSWEKSSLAQLVGAGLLFGLSTVTKSQYLLILAPALAVSWLANLFYYKTAPQRVFIIPALLMGACYLLWQVIAVLFLGPSTAAENLVLLRQSIAGAALVFSPSLMVQSAKSLFNGDMYLGWLVPALVYGIFLVLPRRKSAQKWGVLLAITAANLGWYIMASIGWVRYAFPGIALGSLFLARFLYYLSSGFKIDVRSLWQAVRREQAAEGTQVLPFVSMVFLVLMLVLPLGQTLVDIVHPPQGTAQAMADYLNKNVPQNVLIETWEPELGFLTNHNYHYPPNQLLDKAVGYMWRGGPSPADDYHFVEQNNPPYVLIGEFARWVSLYPDDYIGEHYQRVALFGAYALYQYVH